jgi:cardiolipin synthase A/B
MPRTTAAMGRTAVAWHDERDRFRRILEGVLGEQATDGNRIDVLRNGDEIFPAMLDAIRRARQTVDFLTFVYWEGTIGQEFAEALCERAKAGVRVRALLDAVGAYTMDRDLLTRLRQSGAQVEWFRPLARLRLWETNNRSHRKVLVCDEAVGFTGGVGIADEWRGDARHRGEWRDTHFRLQGPALGGLRAAFLDNWAESGQPLFDEGVDRFPDQPLAGDSPVQVVRGVSETGWSDITTLTRTLLELARHRVRLSTAYFVPDRETLGLLCATASRGVCVEVLLPGPHADKRFCQLASERQYAQLLEAGVRVHAFQPSMLHAKVMTVDGLVANVGSANFNARSLNLDDEVNLVVHDPAVVAVLDGHMDEDCARSVPVDPEVWADRSMVARARERGAGLLRRYL